MASRVALRFFNFVHQRNDTSRRHLTVKLMHLQPKWQILFDGAQSDVPIPFGPQHFCCCHCDRLNPAPDGTNNKSPRQKTVPRATRDNPSCCGPFPTAEVIIVLAFNRIFDALKLTLVPEGCSCSCNTLQLPLTSEKILSVLQQRVCSALSVDRNATMLNLVLSQSIQAL